MVKSQGVWLKTTELTDVKEAHVIKGSANNNTFGEHKKGGKKPLLIGALAVCCCTLLLLVGLHVYPSFADVAPEPVIAQTMPEVLPAEPAEIIINEPQEIIEDEPEEVTADEPEEVTEDEPAGGDTTPVAAANTRTENMSLASRAGESVPVAEAGSEPDTITVNGEEMNYSSKLTVESTAYTWTGNTTATGTWPERGTVAVDPRVIPLGSKLYIEGYGFATAEDTGGAIKGNIIDVYFSSYDECIQWGRKRGLTVYVLE